MDRKPVINDELLNLLIKHKVMKERFLRVLRSKRNGMLKQIKQLNDSL